MNKYLKIALFVAVFGVVAYIIYYLFSKNKTVVDPADAGLQLPPSATPPINGITGLQDPNSGAGLAAIDRRTAEILASSDRIAIQDAVRADVDILNGVNEIKKPYYNQNISRNPITSARNIPYNLSPVQRSAINQFKTIDTSNGTAAAENLLAANRQMLSEVGTCFIGNPELQNTDEFIRQVYCQGYVDCGKNYKNMGAASLRLLGGQKAGADMAKMASAWIAGSDMFNAKVKEKAIQDLRNVGWKFKGFDF